MKNICIFTNTLLKGGAEKQALLLSKALTKYFNVWLVVFYGEQKHKSYLDFIARNRLRVFYLRGRLATKIVEFHKFCKNNSIEIIFSYLLTTNLIGGIIGRSISVKYSIGGIRNSVLDKKKAFIQKIVHNYLNAYTIFNNYRGFENLSYNGFKKDRLIVIPNCIELKDDSIIRKQKDKINIISVGRFDRQKDYYTALKAIKILTNRPHIKMEFTIVGYGHLERNIHSWISEFNLNGIVTMIINPEDLESYYLEADIYLSTSIFEGLSNAMMEAMSFSLPIVATDVGDNNRLVYEGANGYLTSTKDHEKLAAKLYKLAISHEKRIAFGRQSYHIILNKYSYELFQKRYIDFIESLEIQ